MQDKINQIKALQQQLDSLTDELEKENEKCATRNTDNKVCYHKNNITLIIRYDYDNSIEFEVFIKDKLYAEFGLLCGKEQEIIYQILNGLYEYNEYELI